MRWHTPLLSGPNVGEGVAIPLAVGLVVGLEVELVVGLIVELVVGLVVGLVVVLVVWLVVEVVVGLAVGVVVEVIVGLSVKLFAGLFVVLVVGLCVVIVVRRVVGLGVELIVGLVVELAVGLIVQALPAIDDVGARWNGTRQGGWDGEISLFLCLFLLHIARFIPSVFTSRTTLRVGGGGYFVLGALLYIVYCSYPKAKLRYGYHRLHKGNCHYIQLSDAKYIHPCRRINVVNPRSAHRSKSCNQHCWCGSCGRHRPLPEMRCRTAR